MRDTLTALDATFLELEELDEGALMSIGGIMVFDPRPDGTIPTAEDVRRELAPRLGHLPRYTQRLSQPHVGRLSWPRWVPDTRFDVRAHVWQAALPSPGGQDELSDWTGEFFSHRLDRTRPLWELVLIEGLAEGRWALAHKVHHCLVDGIGSLAVVETLLDPDPTASSHPAAERTEAVDATVNADTGGPRFERLEPALQATEAALRAGRAGLHAIADPRGTFARSQAVAELAWRDEVIPAAHCSLNTPIGTARRFQVVTVALDRLKAIRSELGGSVNDAVLAACTSGLRALLAERDELHRVRTLRAMVPVNLREDSERSGLGNRVSSLFVELPVAEPMASVRYRLITATTSRLKQSGAAGAASAVIDLGSLAPPVLHATIARSLYATRLFNVTITNVPGPRVPLYGLGARMRVLHPVVPLAAEHAVGIAIFSYDGQVAFGVIGDAPSTPDLAVLAEGIERGVEELVTLAAPRRRRARRAVTPV